MTFGDIIHNFVSFFTLKRTPAPKPEPVPLRISSERAIRRQMGLDENGNAPMTFRDIIRPVDPPAGATGMAMDGTIESFYGQVLDSYVDQGLGFMGYGYLAQLTQRVEYRMPVEIRAEEMTRKWIELQYSGKEEDGDKIAELSKAMDEFKVRDVFRRAIEVDGEFGRAQIYIDTGASDKPDELDKPLAIDKAKIGKGGLVGFRVIEPLWSYPQDYNSANPLKGDFYVPQTWYVQGRKTHRTRLLTIVSKPVPDILKPAYAFGGVALTQMAIPYVENFLRTRDSISDLIKSFSIMVLKTDMAAVLTGGSPDNLLDRLDVYNDMRDNRGIFAINKDTEEMENLAVPLSSLDKLQAQSQEQMATPFRTPLVKAFGITPAGLNTSTDGEIRTFYDSINAAQEKLFRDHLTVVINAIQLHIWGAIDENITFGFVPLWQPTEAEAAASRKSDADVDVEYTAAGIVDPLEVRKRLAADKTNPYHGLDVEDVPEPPEDDTEEDGDGSEPAA